jgi:hypothetical protein
VTAGDVCVRQVAAGFAREEGCAAALRRRVLGREFPAAKSCTHKGYAERGSSRT